MPPQKIQEGYKTKKIIITALIVALFGFVDAVYLTIEHYRGDIPPCSIVEGCEQVLTSSYSALFGIPVSLVGAIYYLLILVCLFAFLDTKRNIFLKGVRGLSTAGLLASLGFVYIQAFVIKAYCLYCLISALTTLVVFVLAWFVFPKSSESDRLAI